MPPLLAHWVHDLDPFLFRWGENFGVRYYGLAYLLGFLGGGWLIHRYITRRPSPLRPEVVPDLLIALVIGVFLGGRLGYFFLYQPQSILSDPMRLVRVWEGGMASHGGMLGVAVALVWFAHRQRVPFLRLGDLVTAATPLGILLGRVANFINGELWGKTTTVPWGVIFPASAERPWAQAVTELPARHPSQLYAAFLEGAVLLAFMQTRLWRSDIAQRQPGRLAGEFFLAYAILRILTELFREPDASLILGLSRGTFYSIFLLAAGITLIVRAKQATSPQH
jgi:phosphatidylglycerol:prolipoprotein diacylglycerol transferase